MAGNKTLNKAKDAKNDEFYTQIEDIERELCHYREQLKGKTIFCNCDDPESSNFWLYFQLNFEELELKKLVATHYEAEIPSYKLELVRDVNNDGKVDKLDIIKTPLRQNGDFRSPECIEILKEADIVITNPPFSLFREYIALLLEHNKQFIVIGNQNTTHYKEIFPLIRDNKLWLGYYSGDMKFKVPHYYEPRETRYWVDETGQKWRSMGNACWLTNVDIEKRHETILMYKNYTPEEYPTYDNYNAINVNKISEIPCDYYGEMGVPDQFLEKYNPEQFEIIGLGNGDLAKEIGIKKNFRGRTDLAYTVNGKSKCPYSRIIIKRKR